LSWEHGLETFLDDGGFLEILISDGDFEGVFEARPEKDLGIMIEEGMDFEGEG